MDQLKYEYFDITIVRIKSVHINLCVYLAEWSHSKNTVCTNEFNTPLQWLT